MYFAVVKITFESGTDMQQDRKELQALVEKIRARFRVCVMPCQTYEDDGEVALALTSLAISEEALTKQLDAISEFCEQSGFGRIEEEKTLLDHIDSFGEES